MDSIRLLICLLGYPLLGCRLPLMDLRNAEPITVKAPMPLRTSDPGSGTGTKRSSRTKSLPLEETRLVSRILRVKLVLEPELKEFENSCQESFSVRSVPITVDPTRNRSVAEFPPVCAALAKPENVYVVFGETLMEDDQTVVGDGGAWIASTNSISPEPLV